MSLPNYLSAIKSAGIYRFVWDKSEIEGIPAETLRLVVGYSEKGPFNTPVMIRSASEFKTAFGGISRKLEKRGVFFHRMALQALLSGPIIALNLKKFSREEDKDEIESIGLNSSNEDKSDIITLHVEDIYNKVRFWNLSPETARENFIEKSGIEDEYITIYAADDSSTSKSFIIRGFKPAGYDITIKQWYSNYSEEMPDIYKPIEDTLLNQYFAQIYVFEGEFTSSMAKSKELSKYFDVKTVKIDDETEEEHVYLKPYILNAFGEKIDTLTTLAADKNSNFVKMYSGITLPEFRDNYNNYISLDIVFNTDNSLHKMMMDFNTVLLEDAEMADSVKYLNVSGWYGSNIETGLQKLLDKAYICGEFDSSVTDNYYNTPTGITVMGNNNIVPDIDLMLSQGLDAYIINDSDIDSLETPTDKEINDITIKATDFNCSTTDGKFLIHNNELYALSADVSSVIDNKLSEQGIIGMQLFERQETEQADPIYVQAKVFNMNTQYYKEEGEEYVPMGEGDYNNIAIALKTALEEYAEGPTYNAITFGKLCTIYTDGNPNIFDLLYWNNDTDSWYADMSLLAVDEEKADKYSLIYNGINYNITMIENIEGLNFLMTDGSAVYSLTRNDLSETGWDNIATTNLDDVVNEQELGFIAVYSIYKDNNSIKAIVTTEKPLPTPNSGTDTIIPGDDENINYQANNDTMVVVTYSVNNGWDGGSIVNFNKDTFKVTDRYKVMNASRYYEVYDMNTEARRIIIGFVVEANNIFSLSVITNADTSNTPIFLVRKNMIDIANRYRFDYVVKSISSDSENGGDVKFLTTTSCYENTFEDEDEIICPSGKGTAEEPFVAPTDISKFVTDSYNKFGLEVGDNFLAQDGVATLLAIEDYEPVDDQPTNVKTDVPIKRYIFNKPVKFLILKLNDIEDNDTTDYPENANLILVKLVNPFGVSLTSDLEFTYLKGFDYSNPKPVSTSQIDKLNWQHDILDTLTEYRGLRIGLTEKKDLDYRYIVDTFESFVESECKSRLSLLAKEKDNCLALLNFPFIETFRKCPYTSFTDEKGQLDINFIPQGGNPRKSIAMKFSLPSETNGASWCSFNTALILSDGTIKTTIPPAALVSNDFMEKYVSRQPYYIVAGPNYARINDYQLVGPDFNFGKADLDALEPFGVNCMVYVPRIGTYINSNQTAKQNPVTALSKINIRELVIYLQDEIEKLLQSYQWEFNNQTLRDVIKTKADTICENVKNNGGLYEYINVCDSSNNPPEVVDNEMLVLSTSIEGARGAGKMVQELTLYKTGGLKALINNG